MVFRDMAYTWAHFGLTSWSFASVGGPHPPNQLRGVERHGAWHSDNWGYSNPQETRRAVTFRVTAQRGTNVAKKSPRPAVTTTSCGAVGPRS